MNKMKLNTGFASAGLLAIDDYLKYSDIVLDKKMTFRLNMIKSLFNKILEKYSGQYPFSEKDLNTLEKKIKEWKSNIPETIGDEKEARETIELTGDEFCFMVVMKNISFSYKEYAEKSNNITKDTRTQMRKIYSYWQGYEKYIVGGCR